MEFIESDEQFFLTDTKLFSAKVLEPYFSMGRTVRSTETSADRTMITIVDGEELEKRKASRIPQNSRINTSWAVRESGLNGWRNEMI